MDNQELRKELISLLTSLSYKQLLRCEYHPNIPIVVDEYLSIEKETPTIQVDAKEYERLKESFEKKPLKDCTRYTQFDYHNNPYGIAISTLEETKEDKDHSTIILLVSIVILLGYIIYKIETYLK